jgi:hypothetical protein
VETSFVDKNGKEIPFGEGGKLLKILGFGEILTAVSTSSAYVPEDAIGALVALNERQPYTVRMYYDRENGKWTVAVNAQGRSVEVELVPYHSVSGETRWKATVKLPIEWSPGVAALVDAVDAVAERLEGEVRSLREEVEQLKARLAQAQPQGARPMSPPLDARVARALHELADALHELADAAEGPEEEDEEEEDEW